VRQWRTGVPLSVEGSIRAHRHCGAERASYWIIRTRVTSSTRPKTYWTCAAANVGANDEHLSDGGDTDVAPQ
jgi:hypothetical protein